MVRKFVMVGSLLMLVGVGAGAFGAHGLSSYFETYPNLQDTYETAVRYQLFHAVAIFIAAWIVDKFDQTKMPVWAGWLFFLGIILFSGSLYVLVFTRISWLGAITPFGGFAFLSGWLLLFFAAWRANE